ncbi:MAG: CGNR zinc finger domain-containing protein [Sinobacteraceae bacterium]|nr:CGNR zinc finger domain-containing protein [Nevskiaceae bacterium]
MSSSTAATKPFSLSAGHPALDFVNTLDNRFNPAGPRELLSSYEDLWRFVAQSGLARREIARAQGRAQQKAREAALHSAVQLREAAARAFYGAIELGPLLGAARVSAAEALPALEPFFLEAGAHQQLHWKERGTQQPRVEWGFAAAEADPRLPVWMLARATEQLLTTDALAQVHACDSPSCRWLFLDTSKNHRRRWCDMRICGNRMKARRFQAKHDG